MNFSSSRFIGAFCFFCLLNPCRAELAVTGLFPANQATNVCLDAPLRLTFREAPVLGVAGKISIHRAKDGQLVETIDLSAGGATNNFGGKLLRYEPVQAMGNTVSIQLHTRALNPNETYYVNIEPGVFQDAATNNFAGLTNNSDWKFSTRGALPRGGTNLTIAADGSGDFCTLQGAVDNVSDDNQLPVRIFIRKGVYDGITYIMPNKDHLHFVGEDRKETVVTGRNNDRLNPGRIGRSLFGVDANDFSLENLTLRNTTPYRGSQAEALRINGDRCVVRNVDFQSFQDTLLLSGRVYLTNCFVEGDVDFIWGAGTAFFDRCEIKAVHNGYYLQARNPAGKAGYVFLDCDLTASPEVTQCWLARIDVGRFPGSHVAFINCRMGAHVPPGGWEVKGTNTGLLRFEEFHSADTQGKPLDVSKRHPASKQLGESAAAALSDPAKLLSYRDTWNPRAAAK